MSMRGVLTQEIKDKSKELFGYEISREELRLMPYIQYTMMNSQKLDPSHISPDERKLLAKWKKKGWIEGGMTGLAVTKEFFFGMNEILWLGYVVGGCTESHPPQGVKK